MAVNEKMREDDPSDVSLLLPWYASGRLSARDVRRVEEALAQDPALARQFAVVREEFAETIALNESLGAPSGVPMQKLFAAIDAEPERRRPLSAGLSATLSGFFSGLSTRTLAISAAIAAAVLVVQAVVIAEVLMQAPSGRYQTASLGGDEPLVRGLGASTRALVRFEPQARISDITEFLEKYHASIVGSDRGMFRLQFGERIMSRDDLAALIGKISSEKIVAFATSSI